MEITQKSLDQFQDQLQKPLSFTQSENTSEHSQILAAGAADNDESKFQKIYASNDLNKPHVLLSAASFEDTNSKLQTQFNTNPESDGNRLDYQTNRINISKSSREFALQKLDKDHHQSPKTRQGTFQKGSKTSQQQTTNKISAVQAQGKIMISLDVMANQRRMSTLSTEKQDDTLDQFEKHYSLNLGKVVKQKQTLDHAINSMDIRISDTFLRENLQLENRYLPVEDDARRAICALEMKAKRLEEQNLANATYRQIIQDLQNFKKTSDTLRHKLASLSQSHEIEQKKNQKLKKENQTKHIELYKYSKKNLGLSYQIQELLQQLQQVKQQHKQLFPQQYINQQQQDQQQNSSLFLTDAPNAGHSVNYNNRAGNLQSNQNQSIYAKQYTLYPDFNPNLLNQQQLEQVISMVTMLNSLERQIQEVKQDKKQHIAQHYSKLISVIDMQRMFNQCFASYEHEILKNQQLQNPQREEGMNQSFFFELQRRAFNRSGIQKNKSQQALQRMKNKYPLNLIDLQLKDVIYGTLKSLANAAKENKKRAHILSVGLDWEDFNNFTPKQIVGLLLLRDDGLQKLRQFALPQLGKSLGTR